MLWDLIRDFFVMNVFGGIASNGDWYGGLIGNFNNQEIIGGNVNTGELYFPIGPTVYSGESDYINTQTYISMGDWLSTTATIISISIIVILCCLFVYKIIKLIGGLIR